MEDFYEVDDDRILATEYKTSAACNTEQPVYKYGWKWNKIYHRREEGCQRYAAKIDGMNE